MLEIQQEAFMQQYFDILSQCPLFDGIDRADLSGMLDCLGGKTVEVPKGDPVFL